jgi:hypothetical protein
MVRQSRYAQRYKSLARPRAYKANSDKFYSAIEYFPKAMQSVNELIDEADRIATEDLSEALQATVDELDEMLSRLGDIYGRLQEDELHIASRMKGSLIILRQYILAKQSAVQSLGIFVGAKTSGIESDIEELREGFDNDSYYTNTNKSFKSDRSPYTEAYELINTCRYRVDSFDNLEEIVNELENTLEAWESLDVFDMTGSTNIINTLKRRTIPDIQEYCKQIEDLSDKDPDEAEELEVDFVNATRSMIWDLLTPLLTVISKASPDEIYKSVRRYAGKARVDDSLRVGEAVISAGTARTVAHDAYNKLDKLQTEIYKNIDLAKNLVESGGESARKFNQERANILIRSDEILDELLPLLEELYTFEP